MGGIGLVWQRRFVRAGRAACRTRSSGAHKHAPDRFTAGWDTDEASFVHPGASGVGGPSDAAAIDSATPSESVGDPPVTDVPVATIGLGPLRPSPAGLPD